MEINRFSRGPEGASEILNYSRNNLNNSSNQNLGVNPLYPYVGDPLFTSNPPPLTIGTGPGTSWPPAALSSLNVFGNPFGALGDFFNVQYLSVEAVCAVTRRQLKPGEPVLILDEHVISKTAFMKLLRESFEKISAAEETL